MMEWSPRKAVVDVQQPDSGIQISDCQSAGVCSGIVGNRLDLSVVRSEAECGAGN